jgi:hypothetical protein
VARDTEIDPVLKAWLDNVLVPAMVRKYLDACHELGDNGVSPTISRDSDTPNSERVQ